MGTGNWSVVSGTATITTPSSPSSGVTGLLIGMSATLRWTISDLPCSPSADDVVIAVSTLPDDKGVSINITGNSPNPSSILDIDVSPSNNLGMLIPRINSAQRDAIPSPAIGLLIFNITTSKLNYYKSTGWYEIKSTFVSSTTGTTSEPGKIVINLTGASPSNSTMLDITSVTRGVLVPRTTSNSLCPVTGLIYYDNPTNRFGYYDGTTWCYLSDIFITATTGAGSQNSEGIAINTDGLNPDASAILDVKATDKGVLIPMMTTTNRDQILPAMGLMIYNTTSNVIEYYSGSDWYKLEVE